MSASLPPVAAGPAVPDLMLSFRHRDALADMLALLGRRVVAARRAVGLADRFRALGAHILLIDARDAAIEALTAVESVAAAVAERGRGLIVILGEGEAEMAPAFIAAGAHQLLGAPWRDWELAAALLAADRSRQDAAAPGDALIGSWYADVRSGAFALDRDVAPVLQERFGGIGRLRNALRRVDAAGRHQAIAALRRLIGGAPQAVFVQQAGEGRWLHHLSLRATALLGQVETLDHHAVLATPARDRVTGLPTFGTLAAAVSARHEAGQPVALALVELGRLARVNDAAGRASGDALLTAVGRRLERQLLVDLGPGTVFARAPGARFAVLAPASIGAGRLGLELRAAAAAATELLAFPGNDSTVQLRVATGMVASGEAFDRAFADVARRLAAPRARVRTIDVDAILAGDELRILFQPQFAMADDRLTGAEALARWRHPRLGEVAGGVLFAAAQATGQERALSDAIWTRALGAMAQWPSDLDHVRVALNITAADLADPLMPASLLALMNDHGIAPARLTVEVTEAAVITALDDAAAALRRLRAAGLCVALDDFGTGYSGLSWLKRLPVDYIKIDGGFARDAVGAPRDRVVLGGVIALARALELDVLAEGVETAEQRAALAAAGCRWYQGHLRAPALSDAAFRDFADN